MSSDFIAAHPWAYTFVVGRPSGNSVAQIMNSVSIERCHYKDVLTVDVLENYYNLTWKKMDALDYLVKSGLDFDVVLKSDIDVFVNIQLILEWLPDVLSQSYKKLNSSVRPFYAGSCPLSAQPIRTPESKWYLSLEDYPPTKFPPFCFGAAYFLSLDLIKAMLNLSDLRKSFRLEDVHTGLLVNDTGLVPSDHVVDPGRIYNYDPGRCLGFRTLHQYPFAVAESKTSHIFTHYNAFMQSLCELIAT
jgi:hypothetical protein